MRAWPRVFAIGRRGICLRFSPVPIIITVWGSSSVREDNTNTSTSISDEYKWMFTLLLCISAAHSTRSVLASSRLFWRAITDGMFHVAWVIAVIGTVLNWISLSARYIVSKYLVTVLLKYIINSLIRVLSSNLYSRSCFDLPLVRRFHVFSFREETTS